MCKCPYCKKEFKVWKSVRAHTSKCSLNSKEYIICTYYGSLKLSELNKFNSYQEFKLKYPLISFDSSYFRYLRLNKGLTVKVKNWSNEDVINSIKEDAQKLKSILRNYIKNIDLKKITKFFKLLIIFSLVNSSSHNLISFLLFSKQI